MKRPAIRVGKMDLFAFRRPLKSQIFLKYWFHPMCYIHWTA